MESYLAIIGDEQAAARERPAVRQEEVDEDVDDKDAIDDSIKGVDDHAAREAVRR